MRKERVVVIYVCDMMQRYIGYTDIKKHEVLNI